MEQIEVRVGKSFAHRAYEFFVWNDGAVARDITFEKASPGQYVEPVFRLSEEQAQVLIDDLYAAGVRPTAASGSAGAMGKIEAHLRDMRRIAFGKLKIEEPK